MPAKCQSNNSQLNQSGFLRLSVARGVCRMSDSAPATDDKHWAEKLRGCLMQDRAEETFLTLSSPPSQSSLVLL